MGKDSKNHKNKHQSLKARVKLHRTRCAPLQKHLCRAPRLIRGCLREAAGDSSSSKDNLMQSFICVSSYNLTLQPGEWSPKRVWHISFFQSQAFPTSCSLLLLIHWQYFLRENWSHLPKITQEESSQKALSRALICVTLLFGPKLVQAGALDHKKTRTINTDLHPLSSHRTAYFP